MRAEIGADGTPQRPAGPDARRGRHHRRYERRQSRQPNIDHAEYPIQLGPAHRTLAVPFQIQSGGNQFTLRAMLEAPSGDSGSLAARRDPRRSGDRSDHPRRAGEVERRGHLAQPRRHAGAHRSVRKRIELDQGDLGRVDTRPTYNVGLAVTGSLDYSGADPRLAFGVAGTRMPVSAIKRLWPAFIAAARARWVERAITGGTVERVVIAGNAPLSRFQPNGPPMPDDGLSVDIETSGTTLQPSRPAGDPRRRLTVRIIGRTATSISAAARSRSRPGASSTSPTAVRGAGHALPSPPARVPASASTARCRPPPSCWRSTGCATLSGRARSGDDPRHRRRAGHARTAARADCPGRRLDYAITADLTNFAADKMLLGQKVEAATLRVSATNQGYQIKGDVKIAGTPATIEYRKPRRASPTPILHLQARSTRRRAPGSASISATPSPAPSRSSSPAASAATSTDDRFTSRPI